MTFLETFFLLVLTAVTTLVVKHFWGKYAETKGANQATKEDIGEITKIVESIKSELSEKVEQLRAQLSFKNQHLLEIKKSEREAYLQYHNKVSAWKSYLVNMDFANVN